MKKPYSLDYTIERDTDRLKLVEGILDTLDHDPSETDIEQMATYILYGKDENGLSSLRRGEVYDNSKRYNSFKTSDDYVVSLDEMLKIQPPTNKNLEVHTSATYIKSLFLQFGVPNTIKKLANLLTRATPIFQAW